MVALKTKRIVHAMVNAEFSDGLGQSVSNNTLIILNNAHQLREGLMQAKLSVKFVLCADVSQLKLNQIDEHLSCSPKREIARACKTLLSMKVPHGQRRWGISITPRIEEMLANKTQLIIETLYERADDAVYYYEKAGFDTMDFSRYVGNLVSAAIQILPSNKEELSRIYNEIWQKREKDRLFPTNKNQKTKEAFHRACLKQIEELEFDDPPIPIASLTLLEPSGLAEIQKMHWKADALRVEKVISKAQKVAFQAFMSLQAMAQGRHDEESEKLTTIIQHTIEDVEITTYWLHLLNSEFQTYQQITCHDWCRLQGFNIKNIDSLVNELSHVVKTENTIELRIAFLRLLLPLIESWVLCIFLERRLKKSSVTRHISAGLRELKEHIDYARPELSETFNKLKQFARPYDRRERNEK